MPNSCGVRFYAIHALVESSKGGPAGFVELIKL